VLLPAILGPVTSQIRLGILYANGHGVEIDLAAAASWYRKAAEKGNGAAQLALGLMYLPGRGVERDTEKAGAWFKKAADQGNARAQYNFALLNLEERGPGSRFAAETLLRQAARQGLIPAMLRLAQLYESAEAAVPSLIEAAKWYRSAAEAGDAEA
jgi:uncharacterized protein